VPDLDAAVEIDQNSDAGIARGAYSLRAAGDVSRAISTYADARAGGVVLNRQPAHGADTRGVHGHRVVAEVCVDEESRIVERAHPSRFAVGVKLTLRNCLSLPEHVYQPTVEKMHECGRVDMGRDGRIAQNTAEEANTPAAGRVAVKPLGLVEMVGLLKIQLKKPILPPPAVWR
jgi:hypothetical protein